MVWAHGLPIHTPALCMSQRRQAHEVVCKLGSLGRRGYDYATEAGSGRGVKALQSDDEDFLSIPPKADQLIFVRRSFESMLPLQAIGINVRVDCSEELRHVFSLTLGHLLPCFVDDRVPARALF